MKKILNKKGITLLEILTSITLLSIIITIVTNFYINFVNFHNIIEQDSIANTNIVNMLNSIKYRIDQTTELGIISKDELYKIDTKNENYEYITLQDGKVVVGNIGDTPVAILNEKQINDKINIIFIKDEYKNGAITVLVKSDETLEYYINIQNISHTKNQIIGTTGDVIIYKKEKSLISRK